MEEDRSTPSDATLARVAQLVLQTRQQQVRVAQLETDLHEARASLRALSEHDLPQALVEVDYLPPTKTTIAGYPIVFEEKMRCGQLEHPASARARKADDDVPRAKDPLAAFAYIDENGHGDIVRNQITLTFPKDSEELVNEIYELLRAHRGANVFEMMRRRVVYWNVLAKLATELVEQGYDPPLDVLGVQQVRRVKVSSPKKTGTRRDDEWIEEEE